jgi:HD-GYP domain-containing protein (c-di-GMP phosphodiesterase class II)
VADSFDTMTSGRASQEALTPEIAVQKLVAESGQRLDPDVVSAFLRVWRKKEYQFASNWSK